MPRNTDVSVELNAWVSVQLCISSIGRTPETGTTGKKDDQIDERNSEKTRRQLKQTRALSSLLSSAGGPPVSCRLAPRRILALFSTTFVSEPAGENGCGLFAMESGAKSAYSEARKGNLWHPVEVPRFRIFQRNSSRMAVGVISVASSVNLWEVTLAVTVSDSCSSID